MCLPQHDKYLFTMLNTLHSKSGQKQMGTIKTLYELVDSQQPLFIHICEPLKDGGIDK